MKIDELLSQAKAKVSAGELQAAGQLLEGAPPAERTGAWHYARGTVALQEGQLAQAVQLFEQAVQREPEIAEYRSNLGAALLEQAKAGDAAAAARALQELELAAQWGPRLPDVYANLSLARLVAGDAKGALAAADVGLRLDERHVPTLYNRAAALSALKQLPQCLQTLDELLSIDPTFAPARQSRERTLEKLRKV